MDFGLLLIQAVVGLFVAGHGAQKLFGVLGGFGISGTAGYLEGFGLRNGRLLAYAAGTSELVGGVAFAAGFLTPAAAVLVASTMLVASRTDHRGRGLWIFNWGSEHVLTNAAVAIGLAFNGAGPISVDHAIGWDVSGTWWGIGAAVASVLGAASVLALRSSVPVTQPPAAIPVPVG
jgi:putative oxidoreductase